jgi:methylated-DNA-[protein]-cysteine S-methyltransferase
MNAVRAAGPVVNTRSSSPSAGPLETTTVDTPVGPLAVVVADGVVVAAGFSTVDDQLGRLAEQVRARGAVARPRLGPVTEAVEAYLAGDLGALDRVTVDQPGGPFLQEAWRVMRQIPPGATLTYAELAAKAGRPRAVRAAGSACARNLVAPFVPCHRILRTGGSLGGYYYGVAVKEWLLAHEGAILAG